MMVQLTGTALGLTLLIDSIVLLLASRHPFRLMLTLSDRIKLNW